MNDLENQIKKSSVEYSISEHGKPEDWKELNTTEVLFKFNIEQAFIKGAKSESAKEYWQQGMYSEEEVRELFAKYYRNEIKPSFNILEAKEYLMLFVWFEQNKKK